MTKEKKKRSNNKEYCTSTGITNLVCCAENCNGGCIYQIDNDTKDNGTSKVNTKEIDTDK